MAARTLRDATELSLGPRVPDTVAARADEATDHTPLFVHEIRRDLAKIISTSVVGSWQQQRDLVVRGCWGVLESVRDDMLGVVMRVGKCER